MTTRPRLGDLCCGGGGCSRGYAAAGFEVEGVDLVRQPHYPYPFHLGNVLTYPLAGFRVVHASPPCKRHTTLAGPVRSQSQQGALFDAHTEADVLAATIDRLREWGESTGGIWVIENVTGAADVMPPDSVTYCGSSFGLDVKRHRLFASNVPLTAPACDHERWTPRFQSLYWPQRQAGRLASVVSVHGHLQGGTDTLETRQAAMGIDWLPNDRLTQAIPPAYTEHIGRQLLAVM